MNNKRPFEVIADKFCNHTYERMVLSGALVDMDKFYTLLSTVEDIDFLSDDNRALFGLLKVVHGKDIRTFDLPLVAEHAKEIGVFDLIGGYDYLLALTKMNVSKDNFEHALSQLLDLSTKFKLYNKLEGHLDLVDANATIDSDKDAGDLIGEVQSSVMDLSIGSKAVLEPKHISDGLAEYIEERRNNRVKIVGVPTGYPLLDSQIDGQIPGTLFVVAARKKMGKSALLTNIALNVGIEDSTPVLYIDTEMTFPEWRVRALSSISGVEERKIKHGGYTDFEYDKLMTSIEILEKSKVFHHYLPGYNIDKITALYKKYKVKEDIGLAIFDYIKEPESASIDRQRKEHQILGDVTTRLKDLAGELDIPFSTAVQLNRDGDIADSDRIARYADVTAFWNRRDEKYLQDNGFDGKKHGFYGLTIKDSRRGGSTIEPGISFFFYTTILRIKEVPLSDQIVELNVKKGRREE